MPVRPELRHFYGYHWRHVVRPRILARAHGKCERCGRGDLEVRLEVAHLDRKPGHDDDDNLAALCPRCHHKHDHRQWKRKSRATRATRKDLARPLLRGIPAHAIRNLKRSD